MTRKIPKRSRTFADAMRESAGGTGEGMAWRGGILERKPAGWAGSLKGKLGRLAGKDEEDKPESGPELTLHLVRKLLYENASPGGCLGCAGILLGLSAFGTLVYDWNEFSLVSQNLYYTTGEYYLRLSAAVALPLFWIVYMVFMVNFGRWFRGRYEQRLDQACQGLDPYWLLVPGADELAEAYYRPAPGIRTMLFGKIPTTQEQWTEFAAGNFDIYLETRELFRLRLTDWLLRTPYLLYALLIVLNFYADELQVLVWNWAGLSESQTVGLNASYDNSGFMYAMLMVYGLYDSLRDTRKLVFARFMDRHLRDTCEPPQ